AVDAHQERRAGWHVCGKRNPFNGEIVPDFDVALRIAKDCSIRHWRGMRGGRGHECGRKGGNQFGSHRDSFQTPIRDLLRSRYVWRGSSESVLLPISRGAHVTGLSEPAPAVRNFHHVDRKQKERHLASAVPVALQKVANARKYAALPESMSLAG